MSRRQDYGTGTLRLVAPRKWRLRIYAGRTAEGKVRHINRTFTGTETQARRELARVSAGVEQGQISITGREPFSSLLDRWLEQIEMSRRPKTIAEYRSKIERRIRPALGSTRIDRIRPAQLDALYGQWLGEGLSPTTVHHHHAIISTALSQAERWQLITTNPARLASPPRMRQTQLTIPSPAQLLDLIAGAEQREDHSLATAIALAALTGARRGELCALRWSDVDLDAGTVRIARSLTVVGAQVHIGPTKTHAERTVALGDAGVVVLLRRRLRIEEFAAEVGVPLDADPFVLSDEPRADRHLMPDRVSQRFTKLCRTLSMHFRFHDLRHFAATQLIRAGVDVRTVANRLGHADTSTTTNIYAHRLSERDEHAANVLGALLPGRPDVA